MSLVVIASGPEARVAIQWAPLVGGRIASGYALAMTVLIGCESL
jgi:hypothetical protein